MALGYTRVKRSDGTLGQAWARLIDFTADAAYPTGGYILDPKQLGLGTNGVVLAIIPTGASNGFLPEYVPGTGALRIRDASGAVGAATPEAAANLAALNGLVFRCLVIGTGSPG